MRAQPHFSHIPKGAPSPGTNLPHSLHARHPWVLAQPGEFAAVPECAQSTQGYAKLLVSCRDGSLPPACDFATKDSPSRHAATKHPSPPGLQSRFYPHNLGSKFRPSPRKVVALFLLQNGSRMNFGASSG